MKEIVRASATGATQTGSAMEVCCLEERFESLMMERHSVMKEFVRARAIGATQTRLKEKWKSLMMGCHSVMVS